MFAWDLIVLFVLILINGFFSMSELAVVSARRVRLQALAQAGDKGARTAIELATEPARFFSTVQVGISLIGILTGAFGAATLASRLGPWLEDRFPALAPNGDGLALALMVILISYLTLIFGELVPKRLGLGHAETIASRVARPMQWLARSAGPVVWLLGKSTDGVLRLMGQKAQAEEAVTEEEIRTLIAEGTQSGVFVQAERDMIEGVLRLADRPVRAIMTPRPDVIWLDPGDEPDAIRREIQESGYSRFPVCRGDLDEVIGIVQAKDLLDQAFKGRPLDLAAITKKPLVVHDGTSALRVLELFKQWTNQMALVVDEYGSVEGVVTTTDILQSIAGELPEAGQVSEARAHRREDGSWLIDGMLSVDEAEGLLDVEGIAAEGDYHTLAGFVLRRLGHVPKEGEHFEWNGFRFEVVDMDGRRVDKVLVAPIAAGEAADRE